MLRELEIVFWAVLNNDAEIKTVIREYEGETNAE